MVVVNRSAAARYWPGGAVGQRVRIGEGREWLRIAGVVGDIRHAGLEKEEGAVIYMPYAQKPLDFVNWLGILVRGPSAASLVRSVKARIAAVDPTQPVYDVMLVDDYFARARAPYRLNSWIVGGARGAVAPARRGRRVCARDLYGERAAAGIRDPAGARIVERVASCV